jgi:hypothetical protein
MKIVKARLEYYRNEAHFQMMSLFPKRLAECPAIVNIVANLMDTFNTEVESETQTKFEETFILRNEEWADRPTEKLPDIRKLVSFNIIENINLQIYNFYRNEKVYFNSDRALHVERNGFRTKRNNRSANLGYL